MLVIRMSPDEFVAHGRALYGNRFVGPLSADLHISERTIRRWISGERKIPVGVEDDLRRIAREKFDQISAMLREDGYGDH